MRYLLLILLAGCATQERVERASSGDLCNPNGYYRWTDEGYRLTVLELEKRRVKCELPSYAAGYNVGPVIVIDGRY